MKVFAIALSLAFCLLEPCIQSSRAGSATWNVDAPDNSWNVPTDWTPVTVPNGPRDIATFGVSNETHISVEASNPIEVNSIVFERWASEYTINVFSADFLNGFLTISGRGIINNAGVIQNIVADFNASTQ